MASAKATDGGPRRPRGGNKTPYFLQPAKNGQVAVLRRPCGNRAAPKVCGVMPNRAYALALVKQLTKAESAVDDLFLEATDDGIEALEAVLEACRTSVLSREPAREHARDHARDRSSQSNHPNGGGGRKNGRRRRGRGSRGGRVEGGAGEAA